MKNKGKEVGEIQTTIQIWSVKESRKKGELNRKSQMTAQF